jgi:hypothetical protein
MEIIAPVAIANDMPGFVTAGGGTYWDRSGVLQVAAANTLRVTYDPTDLSRAPYALLEGATTNLLQGSDSLAGAAWGQNGGLLQDGGFSDPRGGVAASRWTLNGVGNGRFYGAALHLGDTYALSFFYRFVGGTGRLVVGAENVGTAFVDAASGNLLAQTGNASARVTEMVNGWTRVEVVFVASAASVAAIFYAADPDGLVLDVFGSQLEAGFNASSYIPTSAGATATRVRDQLPDGQTGLVFSNIVESDANDGALWVQGAYAKGTRVRRPNHRVYSALQDVTSTVTAPENNTAGTTPYWQDVGPTERFSVFDNKYSTFGNAPETVMYVLRPGAVCTALATLGIDGSDARVSVVDVRSGILVYQRTKNLRVKNCSTLLDYFYKPIMRRRDEVFDDLPRFKDSLICVTITKPGSLAQLSDVVVGRLEYVGEAQWEPEIRTLRRSLIEDDGFGALKFTKRRSSKLINVSVRVDNSLADNVVRIMDEYTDEPCVIVVDSRWTSLIILGFVQDFSFVLKSPAGSLYNAQAQGFA